MGLELDHHHSLMCSMCSGQACVAIAMTVIAGEFKAMASEGCIYEHRINTISMFICSGHVHVLAAIISREK